jgi:hypothetical protein
LLAGLIFGAASGVGAQEPAFTIDLTAADVKPGSPVYVNVMLSNPGGARVVQLRESVAFPPEKLTFVRAQLSLASLAAGAALTLEMKDKSGATVQDREAAQRVDLRIAGKSPLEDGPLVELEFRLVEGSAQRIRLVHTVEALDDAGRALAGLEFADGHVVVTEETGPAPLPIHACFFYMH